MTEKPAQGRRALELCAGIGGIGHGLRDLGYEIVRAYDSWTEAVDIYNYNSDGTPASACNLLSATGRAMILADARRIGEVDLLAAGPPCKGFSQLRNGRHDGRNGHNRVLAAIPEYVALVRPRTFLIENVPDLVRHRNGKTLDDVLARLRRPGKRLRYRTEHHVYNAAAYGTPQARRRLFIFGVREGAGTESLPKPGPDLGPLFTAVRHGSRIPDDLLDTARVLLDPQNEALTTASQALSDLPLLSAGDMDDQRAYACLPENEYQRWIRRGAPELVRDLRTPRVNPETLRRLKHIPPGGCARSIPTHRLNGLARRYDSAYRRLHPDAPSTALSTKYDCVYHFALPRSLSVREYARLQAIPDCVTFPTDLVCRRFAYEMIGNSVPPLLVRGVLGKVLDAGARHS